MPIWRPDSSGLFDSLANGSACALMDMELQDPQTGIPLKRGTIVGGRLHVIMYTTDGAALTAGRGPFIVVLNLVPETGGAAPSLSLATTGDPTLQEAELAKYENTAWMMASAFLSGGSSNVCEFLIELRTARKFDQNDRLYLQVSNRSGATTAATATAVIFGELYIVEDKG